VQNQIVEFTICRVTAGDSFQGAEFRVVGLPAGSVVLSRAVYPGAIEIGDPLAGGVNLGLPACDNEAIVVLYQYRVLLLNVEEALLTVEAHTSPSNPAFQCPNTNRCDAPVFTKSCEWGGWAELGLPPSDPFPADGAVGVPQDVQLSWTPGTVSACGIVDGAATYVYLGTDQDPPFVYQNFDPSGFAGPFDPGVLMANQTYTWRVVHNSNGTVTGPLWSFTTGQTLPVESTTWHAVKRMYR
jgi:hypothetical protein